MQIEECNVLIEEDRVMPRFLPNYLVALLPALYAWQVHDAIIGTVVWCATLLALAAQGWIFILRGWPLNHLNVARAVLVVASLVLIGLSAATVQGIDH